MSELGNNNLFGNCGVVSSEGLLPANNLSDLPSAASARANLNVYSKSESSYRK